MPKAAWLIFAASVGALAFVFISQYVFGYEPCVLCIWQRVPYGLAAVLSLIAVVRKPYGFYTQILMLLCASLFVLSAGLALFHTGVELHWWLGTSGCAVEPLSGASVDDVRTALLKTPVARCDQISWTFLGFSMANWNIPFSLGLAGLSVSAARKT
ncbi:MAG: disulfide bond formation protein B [Alphaproteobacteria bacterium]